LHATTWQTYRHLVWPYCLPKILTSLRVSLGTAIAVLFLAETFASTDGLGYFILDAMERKEYPAMYAGILAMGLLGVITYALVDLIENRFCKWTKY
ncbi:MAG: ABC transporter permease, partial [Bacillota bacterium]